MGYADGVAKDSRIGVSFAIDVDAANEWDQLAGLGALMRPSGVNRLPDQVDCQWIIPHFRFAKIAQTAPGRKNFHASEMLVNPEPVKVRLNRVKGSGATAESLALKSRQADSPGRGRGMPTYPNRATTLPRG